MMLSGRFPCGSEFVNSRQGLISDEGFQGSWNHEMGRDRTWFRSREKDSVADEESGEQWRASMVGRGQS